MPYTDFAPLGGKPVELYHFASGSAEWYWTSAELPVTVTIAALNGGSPVTFTPVPIIRGNYAANAEAKTQNIEVTVARDNAIAAQFTGGAPFAPITLEIYGWQRDDTVAPTYPTLFRGQVNTAKLADSTAVLQCGPAEDLIQGNLLQVLQQPTCNNTLYGTRCGVVRATKTHAASVDAIGLSGTFVVLDATTAAVFAGDVATYGRGRLKGGAVLANNERQTIIDQDCTAGTITLLQRLKTVKPGNAITLYEGCDKLATTCDLQFSNFDNHQGFANIPIRNPFAGSVV